jgi:ABC-type lipoprotein release transport system permease subunit
VLAESDTSDRAFVVVVDEGFARRFFPGQDPLGQRIVVHWGDRQPREIVGIVNDVNPYSLSAGAAPHMYVSFQQVPRTNYGSLLMRTEVDPNAVIAAARTQVQAIDPSQPVFRAGTLNDILQGSVSDRRFHLVLLATFATTAVLLAAVGIYGVMACMVGERRREMAIRIAMGANRAQVIGLVLGQGTKVAMLGVLVGVAGALALTDLLTAQLHEVRPTDPATFAMVAVGLCALTVLACAIPARRAAAVSPAEALRHE